MSYFGELSKNARPLAAACLGCGTSLPLFAYTNSVFAPHLIRDFHWSRAQFALVGVTMLTTLLVLPVIGRFTDRIGVRKVALIGTCLLPLCFIGYSLMQGNFYYFLLISTLVLGIGSMTSPLVYTRLIAENIKSAQGLALTIVNCTPAVLAIVLVPVLNWTIEHYGWRVSYLAMGVLIAVCGIAAILIMPSDKIRAKESVQRSTGDGTARRDFGIILRSKLFWIIVVAMFLCQLQTPLHASQMNIMLLSNNLTTQMAANIVTVYAFGTIVGRIGCGLALDRFSTPIVTAISMGLPALGYFLLGTDLDTPAVISAAMFLVGLAIGAESDLFSFLTARYFKLNIFSTTLSLFFFGSFAASAIGAIIISLTLSRWDSFSPYLYLVTGTVVVGSILFMLMPGAREFPKIGPEEAELKAVPETDLLPASSL